MGASATENPHLDAKTALRRRLAAVWAGLDLPLRSAELVRRALDLPELVAARTIATYVALPSEVATATLIATLGDRGVLVLLPVVAPDGGLSWRRWRQGDPLSVGLRGTMEPTKRGEDVSLDQAEVVIVPGLAFDVTGGRLGRGGGAFDRALAGRRRPSTVVAMAPDEVVLDTLPTEEHDQAVDIVVTPTRVLRPRALD